MAAEDGRKLFVAGLADSLDEEVLRQVFSAVGVTVVDVSLPRDRATGRPRGFGFVTVGSSTEAESALRALDGSMQAGRSMSVRPFRSEPMKRGEGRPGDGGGGQDRTLYVGNLPYDTSQQELDQTFQAAGAGAIVRVNLPTDHDGRPRGFAFVTMGSAEGAQAAADALQGVEVRGRRLIVNIAHPRGERPRGPGGPGGPGGPPPRSFGGDGPPPIRADAGPREAEEGRRTFDEGRRFREAAPGPSPGAAAKKKKKKHKGQRRSTDDDRRGGGGSWRDWDDD